MILDFSSPVDFVWALLPEIIVAVTGLVILLLDVFQRGRRSAPSGSWVGPLAITGLVAAVLANAWLMTLEVPAQNAMLAVDGFRIAMNFIVLGVGIFGLLYSFDWLYREGQFTGEFVFLVLMALVGMMMLGGTRDLIVLFVAVELMSISVYVLTGYDRRDRRSSEAALKYFLMGAFASGFLLYGIALIFGSVGSTNLSLVTSEIARGTTARNPLLFAGVALLLVGFGFKISAVPFHMWTPDAYEGAPTPVTGFMAAGVKAAGFAAILRFITIELAPAGDFWHGIIWWLALLTMIVPNLAALAQDDVKRMLAYSSIAHAGYLLVGVAADSPLGRSATLFYLAVYAVMTLGSFAIVYVVAGKGDRRAKLSDFRGLGWRRPLLGAAMVVFLLSLAGFPPTAGFIGKLYLLSAAVDAGEFVLAITLVLTSLVSYYYYLRVIWKMYFEEAPATLPAPARPGVAFRFSAGVGVLALLAAGLFPGHVLRTASAVGEQLVPRSAVVSPGTGPAARPAGPARVAPATTSAASDAVDPER